MRIRCVCGEFHEISLGGLALVVAAYQEGDVQTIGRKGIESVCLENAFTDERIRQFVRRYPGTSIQFKRMGSAYSK